MHKMPKVSLGTTGLSVSKLGFGPPVNITQEKAPDYYLILSS